MAFVLPAAKCELKLTPAEQGMAYVVVFIGLAIASPFWGILADTWGRRKVLQRCSAICFIGTVLSSVSTNSLMLMATRFIIGIA